MKSVAVVGLLLVGTTAAEAAKVKAAPYVAPAVPRTPPPPPASPM